MKKRILNNWPLKILALVLAFATWFIVVQITDPQITEIFEVPVTFENENVITERGQVVHVVDEAVAKVKVTKPRSVINSLSEEDFSAVADYSQMYRDTQVPITVTSKTTKLTNSDIELVDQSLEVSIESLETITKVIEHTTTGEPAAGYIVGTVELEPSSISIICPKSYVQYIKTARASFDVNGLSESAEVSGEVKLYDGNDDLIDFEKVKGLSIQGDGIIKANIEILPVHTVPIVVDITDTDSVAEGCTFESVKASPEKLSVYGDKSVMQNLTEIHITGISAKDLSETTTKEIDVRSYLPDGAKVYQDQNTVTIKINITKPTEKTLTIASGDVALKNLSSSLQATAIGDTVIKVTGSKDVLANISSSDIKASADLKDLKEGEHEVKLNVDVTKEGATLVDAVSVKVKITKK